MRIRFDLRRRAGKILRRTTVGGRFIGGDEAKIKLL